MQAVRTNGNRIHHHSGKVPFSHRAKKHYQKGSKAAWIETFGEVYGADPRGATYAVILSLTYFTSYLV